MSSTGVAVGFLNLPFWVREVKVTWFQGAPPSLPTTLALAHLESSKPASFQSEETVSETRQLSSVTISVSCLGPLREMCRTRPAAPSVLWALTEMTVGLAVSPFLGLAMRSENSRN